jgi:hypothetical protein
MNQKKKTIMDMKTSLKLFIPVCTPSNLAPAANAERRDRRTQDGCAPVARP